jgi:hypothetical protein
MVTKPLKLAYRELIHNRRQQIPFWMLVGFLPTFLSARLIVFFFPDLFLNVRGVHVHHFIYGFFVMAIVGFVALTYDKLRRVQAFVYGIGLALCFDEFGMWLKLTDDYNIDASEDALAVILAILVFLVYGIGLLRRAYNIAHRRGRPPQVGSDLR